MRDKGRQAFQAHRGCVAGVIVDRSAKRLEQSAQLHERIPGCLLDVDQSAARGIRIGVPHCPRGPRLHAHGRDVVRDHIMQLAGDADAVERDFVLLGLVGLQDPPRP